MTESATPPTPAEPAAPAAPEEKPAPWGEDFDPARAWALVSNLRNELGSTKTERDALKSAAQAAIDAEKSELQKAIDKAAELEARAAKAERELVVSAAIKTHGLADDVRDFLTGTAEEIEAKAARLAAITKPAGEPAPEVDPLTAAGRPAPALTPGHGGEAPPEFDPAAIAKAARGR